MMEQRTIDIPHISRGILIAIEGIDGSGKSTLVTRLADYLTKAGHHACPTREPGATVIGKKIRTLIGNPELVLTARAEYLLFAADRAQHFHDIVKPALAAHKIVISDRMSDSSCAYQAYGNGLDYDTIERINRWTMESIIPDITLFLRISPTQAHKRIAQRSTDMGKFETDYYGFLNRVACGYDTMYAQTTKTVYTLDATTDSDTVFYTALQYVRSWIIQHHP